MSLVTRLPAGPRRALIFTLSSAAASVVLLLVLARWSMPSVISGPVGDAGWTGRSRAWFTPRGFLGAEVDVESGRQFSWTAARARILFPNLDRSQPYQLTLNVSTFRPEGTPLPTVVVAVDRVTLATVPMGSEPSVISVDLPARASSGAALTIDLSNTFVPGAGDARSLGVMVNDVRLSPASGHFRPSTRVLTLTAAAVGMTVLGMMLCGVAGPLAVLLSSGVVAGFVGLLRLDAAFMGDDVERLLAIGLGAGGVGGIVGLVRHRWGVIAGLPEWSVAAGVVLAISAVKLACFTHPQIALTDALFQVHRAELVHRGEYFFTSVTPSPSFEFPYAIALYVAALPFWSWFPSDLELANLLRGLALVSDALVGVAIYAMTRRQWGSAPVALLAAALWPLTRAPSMALGHANLTNLFGQGLFGVAIGVMAAGVVAQTTSVGVVVAGFIVLTLAFLSHFSTVSIGLLLLSTVIASLVVFGGPSQRRAAAWLLAVMLAAFAVSYVVYYSHFTALYRETFTRIVSGVDQASSTSMVASPAVKWQRWITEDQFSNDYGLPGLALFVSAVGGAIWLLRTRPRDSLTLILAAWAVIWIGASTVGIVTSVELRANLAATPMFTCLAAFGLGTLGSRSRPGGTVAALGVAAIGAAGIRVWLMWLGVI